METNFTSRQRIARLTPLAELLAAIEQLAPAMPRQAAIADAIGRALAMDAIAPRSLPVSAIALRDGVAVQANATADASAYAPIPLAQMPPRVDAGEAIPSGADSIAPLDAITSVGGAAQAIAPVTPGDGILPAGTDANAAKPILKAGQMLRASDAAILDACGIAAVTVREPRICIVRAGANSKAEATVTLIANAAKAGCKVVRDVSFDRALRNDDCDAIIAIGGTGTGRDDIAVELLARSGKLVTHGIGIMPGDTSAFGFVQQRPVLLLPGRIDAALAGWLMIGRPLISRLSGATSHEPARTITLSRKATSTIGIVDVLLVRQNDDKAEPLASGHWPMQAIAQADGFIAVPAQSEGYPEGASVPMRPLP